MRESFRKPSLQVVDDAIAALVELRNRLASDSFFDDVRAEGVLIKEEIFLHSKAEFDNGCKYLRILKDMVKVIKPLFQPLNRKIREMKKALLRPSYYYGLEPLPNEIFMRIMDLLSATSIGYTDHMELVKNLSSVSRRFRDGVVDTTSFWDHWDNEYGLDDGFEHRLRRSKEAPLFVDLSNAWQDLEKIFTRILPYRNRFHHFSLGASEELEELGSTFPIVDFPSVRSLEVFIPPEVFKDTFFTEWTFPNVSSVKLWNIIAPPGAYPEATSFTLHVWRDDIAWYLPTLTSLLRTMPALITLDLDVTRLIVPSATTETLAVEFPNITTFSIGNYSDCKRLASIDDIGIITRALKLPNVENITVRLYLEETEEGENWVSKIFQEGVPFRTVKGFRLTVTTLTYDTEFALFFNGFSSRFPNLHSLRVDQDQGCYDDSFSLAESFDMLGGRLPHLHSLTVLDMDIDWSGFYKWFTSLTTKGVVINHLSVTKMQGLEDPETISDMLKQNNADIEFKVLPRMRRGMLVSSQRFWGWGEASIVSLVQHA